MTRHSQPTHASHDVRLWQTVESLDDAFKLACHLVILTVAQFLQLSKLMLQPNRLNIIDVRHYGLMYLMRKPTAGVRKPILKIIEINQLEENLILQDQTKEEEELSDRMISSDH